MSLPSKEEYVLRLFLNEPSKHWHFSNIVKQANISKTQASMWLKRFIKEKLVLHVKPKGKMPYFQANFETPDYKNKKKIFALNKLYKSGFLSHLQLLSKAKTIIIFGSFVRSDWHTDSDIDLFIYGNTEGLNTAKYWKKLHRQIQPHIFQDLKEIKKINSGLMKNIIDGYVVKGSVVNLIEVIQ